MNLRASITRLWIHIAAIAFAYATMLSPASAQGGAGTYPNKPIQIIEGFAAGGGSDILDRLIGQKLTERFGQAVVVLNRPGAATTIAAKSAAGAAPDGYTLFMAVLSALAPSASLYPNLTYDLMKDFVFITTVAYGPTVLLVNPSLPVKTVEELVAYTKANPGKVAYGSGGTGSPIHMVSELFKSRTGADLFHVPYKGAAPVVTALLSGEIQVGFSSVAPARPLIDAGKVRALAVTSPKRLATLPNVPTVAESGYADFEMGTWYGLLAPAGTPDAIVKLLNAEIARILTLPDVQTALEGQGLEPIASSSERFKEITQGEVVKWARVIKEARIKVDQ